MCRDFHPLSAFPGMASDDRHIWGFRRTPGDVELLYQVFKVEFNVECVGHAALRDALKAAYRKTHAAICGDPQVQACFCPEFVERLHDWDEIVVRYLNVRNDSSAVDVWREETTRLLQARRYPEQLLREHMIGVQRYANFLEKYSYIY